MSREDEKLSMGDEEMWQQAVCRVTREFALLDPAVRRRCSASLDDMVQLKEQLHRFSAGVGGAGICRECGGACCVRGKYHLTLPDLLGIIERQALLPQPRFDRFPECPYLGDEGCQMSPPLRPYTCVIFNCELIEDRMTEEERQVFSSLERRLRGRYAELEELFGNRFMGGLLRTQELSGERGLLGRQCPTP